MSGDSYRDIDSGGGNISFGNSGNLAQGANSRITTGLAPTPPPPGSIADAGLADVPSIDRSRNVFVVSGRDEQVRHRMYTLLRSLGLHPLEWEHLVAAGRAASPFLGQVVEDAPRMAQAAVVLLTPDDVVRLHPDLHERSERRHEVEETCQARPNVLIELGMVLMHYPERTLIVEFGDLRPIADLGGRNVIRFDGSAISVGKIVERLKIAECRVDDTGADWRDLQPFEHLDAYRRCP